MDSILSFQKVVNVRANVLAMNIIHGIQKMIGFVPTDKGGVTMPDREKAISGLEHCKIGDCVGCPYDQIREESLHGKHDKWELVCNEQLTEDILAILEEREVKNGEWITIWREDDRDTSTHARCSICNRISERPLGEYCKWCGAKMSQE